MIRLEVEGYGSVEAAAGRTMLEVCEEARIPMDTACGGFAACNSCRVTVLAGAAGLDAVHPEEEAFLDAADQRLGCQATFLDGDREVRVRLDPGV
ncbi:MAG: (2Fe-2S)-binding protein [Alphaproteobacteria bacterium]|nr:(2Fe-2S)-binding protein [Alphaproteobacteria bacterium]MCB9697785.1 (2Fe-2S)-binding protein [Alphaproteobacteria bacterium]